MAWEKRPSGHYLYLYGGNRTNGTAIKRYVGSGVLVAMIAQQEVWRRRESKVRRVAEVLVRSMTLAMVRRTLVAERALRRTLAREMARLGYRQHDRGQWRRIRRIARMVQHPKRRTAAEPANAKAIHRSSRLSTTAGLLIHRALDGWLNLASQGNPQLRADLQKHVAAQRAALARAGNSAVEKLLIERVLVCSIEVEFFAVTRTESHGCSLRQANFLERRQAGADRRLTAALRTLQAVRKLLRVGNSVYDHPRSPNSWSTLRAQRDHDRTACRIRRRSGAPLALRHRVERNRDSAVD